MITVVSLSNISCLVKPHTFCFHFGGGLGNQDITYQNYNRGKWLMTTTNIVIFIGVIVIITVVKISVLVIITFICEAVHGGMGEYILVPEVHMPYMGIWIKISTCQFLVFLQNLEIASDWVLTFSVLIGHFFREYENRLYRPLELD